MIDKCNMFLDRLSSCQDRATWPCVRTEDGWAGQGQGIVGHHSENIQTGELKIYKQADSKILQAEKTRTNCAKKKWNFRH